MKATGKWFFKFAPSLTETTFKAFKKQILSMECGTYEAHKILNTLR